MEFYPVGPPAELAPLIDGLEGLVEGLKAGQPIALDEEEQHAADQAVDYMYRAIGKDKEFRKEDAEHLWNGLAAQGLRKVAKSRLYNGDSKGAASTCAKLLCLSAILWEDLLLLAEILARQGDIARARTFIDEAKKIYKSFGQTKYSKAAWKVNVKRVQDIVRSKRSGE